MCNDVCNGLFFKPWIKSVKKSLLFGHGSSNYGYGNSHPYGYNNYNNYGYYYGGGGVGGGHYGSYRQQRGQRMGRTYYDIAKVLNANPYAFPGSRPFPAQPFYPIGG